MRSDTSVLGGDVVIDGTRYVLYKPGTGPGWIEGESVDLQDGTPAIPVSAEWPVGLPGGLGETVRTGQNSDGNAFATFDTSTYGFYRFPPRRVTVSGAAASGGSITLSDTPTWFREEKAPGTASMSVGHFTAVSGSQTVTHNLGTTPKAIILYSVSRTAAQDASPGGDAILTMGVSDLTTERSASVAFADNVATSQAGRGWANKAYSSVSSGAAPATVDEATITAAGATTFTINFTTFATTNLRVRFICIGGSDVSAKVVEITAPTATGSQSVTGVGFRPTAYFLLSSISTAVGVTNNDAFLSLGAADKSGNMWAEGIAMEDAQATANANCARRSNITSCLTGLTNTGTVVHQAKHISMDSDGFTLNWLGIGSAMLTAALCLTGVQIQVGSFDRVTGSSSTTLQEDAIGVPFQTTGWLLSSIFQSSTTYGLNGILSFGGATSSSAQEGAAIYSQDGAASATIAYAVGDATVALPELQDSAGAAYSGKGVATSPDMNQAGWLRWDQNVASQSKINYIAFGPLDAPSNTPIIYCFNGQRSTKMTVSGTTITAQEIKNFGTGAKVGHPAKFKGVWYIPLGDYNTFQKLLYVTATTGDTWAEDASGDIALAFANVQDGNTARLARAHDINKVDMSADGQFDASSFDVGDSSAKITSMDDSGTQTVVTKADGNAYLFDPTGATIKVSSAPVTYSDADNGCGLVAIEGTSAFVYNTLNGLMLYRGNRPEPIGPDSFQTNRDIPNVTHEPFRGRHYEWWPVEDTKYSYGLYRVTESTTKTYIHCYEKTGDNFRIHNFFRYDGIARGMYVDSLHRLWCAFVTDNAIGYFQLGKDGSPDAGRDAIGYGAASTLYECYYPETDFGYPTTLKQLQSCEIKVRNGNTTTAPIVPYILRDGGAASQIGSATVQASGVTIAAFSLNAASGVTLTSDIAADATSVVYTGSDVFTVGNTIGIDAERFLVTAINTGSNTLTVVSGRDGSTSTEHFAGASIYLPTDTCYDARLLISVTTTSGYDNTSTSELRISTARLRAFLRPEGARRLVAQIDLEQPYSNDARQVDSALVLRRRLMALERSAPVSVIDPDGNAYSLYVTAVSDVDAEPPEYYRVKIEGIYWRAS